MLKSNWTNSRPNTGGWWEWMECGNGKPERLLLSKGGFCVASDDEWQRVTGRKPNHILSENYWEDTDTTQDQMPGLWRYIGPALAD